MREEGREKANSPAVISAVSKEKWKIFNPGQCFNSLELKYAFLSGCNKYSVPGLGPWEYIDG